ncbi:hypothetical protein Tco_0773588 [Tanacetum coccineum]|uniref:Uncharacterized protein n=1 Tax=Tanacetum coccineum TaxID=301880 RepID=A0ABQ4ZP42_9ASTR
MNAYSLLLCGDLLLLLAFNELNAHFIQGFLVFQRQFVEVKVKPADRAIFDIAKVKVRVLDGTSHETLPRISEADLEVSHQWISVFLSTHLAYELLPESGNAGPDENLKDITLNILQNRVATLLITHSTSNNGSYPQYFRHSANSLPILQLLICSLPLGT